MEKYHNENVMYVSRVKLVVKDIQKMLNFYQTVIGLIVIKQNENTYDLGVGERVLVTLMHDPNATAKKRTTGLYHFALLLPTRKALGQFLLHMLANNFKLTGASDHGVSEALYLDDPEGNGIEIYADREDSVWRDQESGKIIMYTRQINAQALLEEAGKLQFKHLDSDTIMGHLHLHVPTIKKAEEHYLDIFGFEPTMGNDSVSFISDAGYHHHLGLNTWNGVNISNREASAVGLFSYDLNVPVSSYKQLLKKVKKHYNVEENENQASFIDFMGLKVNLLTNTSALNKD